MPSVWFINGHTPEWMASYHRANCFNLKKQGVPFAATWMDLETLIISEISQTEKDK